MGTPFLTQLYPIKIIKKGLVSKIYGKEVIFKFISPMVPHDLMGINELKIQEIKRKQNQIRFLKEEISF